MDDSNACITEGKTSVLSDPVVAARRKRMEIRKLKKLASFGWPPHHDPLSFENSIKRARKGQATIELDHHLGNNPKNVAHPLSLHAEEAIKLDFFCPSASSTFNDLGLFRHKSLPLQNIYTYRAQHCGHPDVDADRRHIVERGKQSSCLLSRILKQQIAGSSSSEAYCSISPSIAPSSMVHVSVQLEIEGSKVEIEDPFSSVEHGTSPCQGSSQNATVHSVPTAGTSDAEMVDLANQSSAICMRKGVVQSPSQSITSSHVASAGHCPPCGKLLVCGRRREMEDTATIVPSFTQIRCDTYGGCLCNAKVEDRLVCDLHFFAVYDGHGGAQASNFCMEKLHLVLAEELLSMSSEGNEKPCESSSLSSMWEGAMISCFSKVDREVGGVCPNGECDNVDSDATCCSGSIAPENVGTTAVVTVLSPCQIVVANCGDSRAVLSRGGKAIPLSRDHKPDRDDEYNRIEAAGGRVIYWDGHRVGGLLALSRAIGDRYLKRYVVSTPEVTCLQRTEEDECLILASDGLWDVISNDTACEIARKYLDSSKRKCAFRTFPLGEDPACAAVAALLVKLAYGRGSKDNISVVVINLKA